MIPPSDQIPQWIDNTKQHILNEAIWFAEGFFGGGISVITIASLDTYTVSFTVSLQIPQDLSL